MDWTALQDTTAWHWLSAHREWLGPLIAGIAFVESFALIGIIVPGVVLLYIAAFLAGSGTLSMEEALAWAFLGAVLGDGCSYIIGRSFHRRLTHIWPFNRHRQWIAKGERFFDEYGALSIVIGRFVGPIRPVMPLVAGMLFMPHILFFSLNFASALCWAPVYILPGYFSGAVIENGGEWRTYIFAGIALILALGIAAIWLRDRYRGQKE